MGPHEPDVRRQRIGHGRSKGARGDRAINMRFHSRANAELWAQVLAGDEAVPSRKYEGGQGSLVCHLQPGDVS